jgi:hypothetical protein
MDESRVCCGKLGAKRYRSVAYLLSGGIVRFKRSFRGSLSKSLVAAALERKLAERWMGWWGCAVPLTWIGVVRTLWGTGCVLSRDVAENTVLTYSRIYEIQIRQEI